MRCSGIYAATVALALCACADLGEDVGGTYLQSLAGKSISGARLTRYTLVSEASTSGQHTGDTSKSCNQGLSECYYKEFLCSGYGVAMQGTGIANNGKLIRYSSGGGGWNANKTWLNNCSSAVFAVGDVTRGASGRVLTADYSIAVDPNRIALGSYVWIDSEEHWFRADDTGGLVDGDHIDVYMAATGWSLAAGNSDAFVADASTFRSRTAPSPYGDQPSCRPVPMSGRIIEEADPCFEAGGNHLSWFGDRQGHGNDLIWSPAADGGGVTGTWQLTFDEAGEYTLDVHLAGDFDRVSGARYRVHHAGGSDDVTINQRASDGFESLGTYTFEAGASYRVELSTGGTGDGRVVFDALRVSLEGLSPDDPGESGGSGGSGDPEDPWGDQSPDHAAGNLVGGCAASGAGEGTGWMALFVLVLLGTARRVRDRVPAAGAVVLLAAAACFSPTARDGLPCSDESQCPSGQKCGFDNICRRVQPEACAPDSCGGGRVCDSASGACVDPDDSEVEPTLDSRAAIGTVLSETGGTETKCVGTLVSASAVLTSGHCVAGADTVSFIRGNIDLAIAEVVVHPDYSSGAQSVEANLALLFLVTPQAVEPITLSDDEPERGQLFTAVVPASENASDRARFQVPVVVQQVDARQFRFSSGAMATPFSCPTSGGPTLAGVQSEDVLVGVHSRSPCEGAGFVDMRVDAYRDWIDAEIEARGPQTCDDYQRVKCGDCGETRCDDSGGQIVESCVPAPSVYPCDGDHTCNSSAECEDPPEPPECTWNGGDTWRPCQNGSECGREYCLQNNTWSGGCAGFPSDCGGNEVCEDQGPSGVYSNKWMCVSDTPITCNTGPADQQCFNHYPLPPTPTATPADGGWDTKEGCSQATYCRYCECVDGGNGQGVLNCTSCFPHNL